MSKKIRKLEIPNLGYLRVAAVSPEMRVADVNYNTSKIIETIESSKLQGFQVCLFPELSITGYTCGDLFYQSALLNSAEFAMKRLVGSIPVNRIVVVGIPVAANGKLFNCAAVITNDQILGFIPKTYLPTTGEYYEERWFSSSRDASFSTLRYLDHEIPFGTNLLFRARQFQECVIGIEICEDLWATNPPSGNMALSGATVILNPSASNELLGKSEYRRELVKQQSARCLAVYTYAGSGPGESTTDTIFSGHSIIAENGSVLAETERLKFSTQTIFADVDINLLINERIKNSSFSSSSSPIQYKVIDFDLQQNSITLDSKPERPKVSRTPFVPTNPNKLSEHAREIFLLQATALAKRIRHVGNNNVCIGISGGLDSTLALLISVRAFEILNLPLPGIVAVNMPGFGTSQRTMANAKNMATLLGVSFREIPISESVSLHFRDINHDEQIYDVVFENSQARERTQILMDVANQIGGFVVGTGDLSETALGWSTYNGDHMSMYHVNAGVPKTLVRYLINWVANNLYSGQIQKTLEGIIVTPISAELLPLDKRGEILQKTEETIGPYELHDFFLYYHIRYSFSPTKVFLLANQAFGEVFTSAEITKWMKVFYRRFFSQQYKRSAMPDTPKIGSVALSPRGDWRMPSDAHSEVWIQEIKLIEEMVTEPRSVNKS